MRQTKTNILVFHELKALVGNAPVEQALVFDNRTKQEKLLAADHVIVNIGVDTSLGPIKDWGLETEGGQNKVDPMMRTSRAGIFAAGDIATFPGKLKIIEPA